MLDTIHAEHVYIAYGYTDLRSGIDRLAALVQNSFHLDPFSGSLFLFCGRRADRIKALHYEKDGFCLLYKRLDRVQEEKFRFQWPRQASEVKDLTRQQFRWLLEGLSVEQPKAIIPHGRKYDF